MTATGNPAVTPAAAEVAGDRLGGDFGPVGGVTEDNILHHRPVTQNHCLVGTLARLRLVNRTRLGVRRMYRAMLIEGKEPPRIHDIGDSVSVVFRRSAIVRASRGFVAVGLGRRITGLDRLQSWRLIQKLSEEGHVRIEGRGRGARYVYSGGS